MSEMFGLCLFLLHKQDKQLVYKLPSKFNYVCVKTCYGQNRETYNFVGSCFFAWSIILENMIPAKLDLPEPIAVTFGYQLYTFFCLLKWPIAVIIHFKITENPELCAILSFVNIIKLLVFVYNILNIQLWLVHKLFYNACVRENFCRSLDIKFQFRQN